MTELLLILTISLTDPSGIHHDLIGAVPPKHIVMDSDTTDEPPIIYEWLSYSRAYRLSMKYRRPLLVLISADWCGPCQAVKKNYTKVLAKYGYLAIVDYDREASLRRSIAASGRVPELVIYHPKDDKLIAAARLVGYDNISNWASSFVIF